MVNNKCFSLLDNFLKWLYKQQLMDVSLPGKRESCMYPKGQYISSFITILFQSESFKKRCYCKMCKYATITFVNVCACMYVCMIYVCMYISARNNIQQLAIFQPFHCFDRTKLHLTELSD